MPIYEYRGFDAAGKSARGIIDAESPKVARAKLRKNGVLATEVVEERKGGAEASGGGSQSLEIGRWVGRVSAQDVALVTRQLATLLAAGLPLVESLAGLIDQVDNLRLKKILGEVRSKVNEGSSLADALAAHSKVFSDLYVSMIRAGETSGALDVVLARLADYIESQIKLRNNVLAALAYPAFMLAVTFGVVIILVTWVIPKVTSVLQSVGKQLPLPTVILIGISDFFRNYWWGILAGGAVVVWGGRRYLASKRGRTWFDGFKLRMPIFGNLLQRVALSRFSRTLSTLLSSGVAMPTALEIVEAIVANVVLADAIEQARRSILEGATVADPLKRSGLFPPIVVQMISVGERSGEIEGMLLKVSETFDREVEASVGALTSLLGPVIILIMGAVIFFIMISVLLPIFEMNQIIRK